jgi:hypothetical protein
VAYNFPAGTTGHKAKPCQDSKGDLQRLSSATCRDVMLVYVQKSNLARKKIICKTTA